MDFYVNIRGMSSKDGSWPGPVILLRNTLIGNIIQPKCKYFHAKTLRCKDFYIFYFSFANFAALREATSVALYA